MSQRSAGQPARSLEPTTTGSTAPRFHDWRGRDVDARIATLRLEARSAIGRAIGQSSAGRPAIRAWAEAELCVQRCIAEVLMRVSDGLFLTIDDIARRDALCADLVTSALLAPDTRTRYAFTEDLLAHATGEASLARGEA